MTGALAPTLERVAVRLRPAPPLEPPFDDELPEPLPSGITMLPLEWSRRRVPERRAVASQPVAPIESPARVAAHRFVGVCVEVLNGFRPVTHLRSLTAPTDLPAITDQLVRRTARVRLGQPARPAARHLVRVRCVRTCEPRDGVAEVAVVLAHGAATWAMAVRLERLEHRWLCRLIQVI
jgi:hypothetical protein